MSTVNLLSFPSDLGKPDLQHWVTFYINVRGKSKFNVDNRSSSPVPENAGAGLNNRQTSLATQRLAEGGAVLGLVNAFSAGSRGNLGEAAISAAATGFSSEVAGRIRNNEGVFATDATYRLSDSITLHMQEAPSVKYGVNYNDTDLGILSGMLSMATSVKDMYNIVTDPGVAQDAKASFLMNVTRLPAAIAGGGTSLAALAGAAFKIKTNPFREVLFESVDYRTFNFRYRFMPRNQQETDAVKKIIDTFKFHMHPELTENKFFYIYPSEFEIVYTFNGRENQYFNKIQNCALTDMTVEYGGDKFASFNNGAPVETILTLTFRELELLTKESIQKNGY